MGRLLSRIAKSHSTGSNRRASHVNPYFTQLRAFMYVFRPVSASALPATTSAHPQHGRCPSSLRGRQDVSRFAAPVCRRPRCVQYGRLSAHQPLAGRRCAGDPARPASRLGGWSGGASRHPQGYLPQPRRLDWRETQDNSPPGTRRLSSRPQRQYQTPAALQERLLLSGMHPADRPVRGHGRFTSLPAGQASAAHQSPPRRRAAPCFSQQEPTSAPHLGSPTPALAQRLDGLCPVRQLVRLSKIDQICPSPAMACDLRPQGQSHAQWGTHRPSGFRSQAPAVYARARHRYGWEHHDLLRAAEHRSSQRCSLRCPCLVFKTAPPGAILGVLSEYGPHSLGPPGLAGLRRAVVMRGRQFLPQNPIGTGGLSCAILRGGGQIYGRCPPRLGVHRTPVYPGARCKGPMLWRHHPTASGRACPRVADRGLADGPGDGRHRAGAATLPAGNRLISLLFSFLPSCQGAKTPLRHPWASCAYATVGKAASMSDFRQCPVEKSGWARWWSGWSVYNHRAEFKKAREFGEALLRLAQRMHDPALLLQTHFALGVTLFFL